MALMKALKNFRSGLGDEMREFGAVLRQVNYKSSQSSLGVNFRKFGASFGAYEFDAFVDYAKGFFKEGIHSSDPLYTVIDMSEGRIAIDYNGELRGIYTAKGRPLAFFRPDFRAAGYRSKAEELEEFRNGKIAAWA